MPSIASSAAATRSPRQKTQEPTQEPAPEPPLAMDPAVPPHVDVLAPGPDGKALMPVLVLPGVRICVEALGPDVDAAEWWQDVAVSALYASLCYQGDGVEPLR